MSWIEDVSYVRQSAEKRHLHTDWENPIQWQSISPGALSIAR